MQFLKAYLQLISVWNSNIKVNTKKIFSADRRMLARNKYFII
jgi:hypothetical protein